MTMASWLRVTVMEPELEAITAGDLGRDSGFRHVLSCSFCAEIANLHVATIRRLEAAAGVRGAAETLVKIQKALEKAGIEFIPAGEGKGPGVRLSHEEASALDHRRR